MKSEVETEIQVLEERLDELRKQESKIELSKDSGRKCSYCKKKLTNGESGNFHYSLSRTEGPSLCFTTGHDYEEFYFCDYSCSEKWKKKIFGGK